MKKVGRIRTNRNNGPVASSPKLVLILYCLLHSLPTLPLPSKGRHDSKAFGGYGFAGVHSILADGTARAAGSRPYEWRVHFFGHQARREPFFSAARAFASSSAAVRASSWLSPAAPTSTSRE